MRSELAHDIFRQDFANIYEEQAQSRMDLKERSEVVMKTWIDEIRAGTLKSSEIETSMMQLSKRLQNTGGKKVYGYLKRDVKDLVDHIVDELEKDDRVSALYREWGLWQDEIVKTYRKQTEELPPLSKQPKLKSIKNMVIAEALRLGSHHFCLKRMKMDTQNQRTIFYTRTKSGSRADRGTRFGLCGGGTQARAFS